ncbi:MAG TPA: AAA family ATPase [Candidatus Saccharimonadales bacterium]
MSEPKLIILRGPSGSGKSTIARLLFEQAKTPTALIEQDHYRFMFKPAEEGGKFNSNTIHKMIKNDTLIALQGGYNVILEGILSPGAYSELLEEIFVAHPKENYMFYFDISFAETVRRHASRRQQTFGEKEMKKWYPAAHRSHHKLEQIIPEAFSIKETLQFIKKSSGLSF